MMMHRGDGNGGRIQLEARIALGGQQLVDRREDGDCVLGRSVGCASYVRLHGCRQSDALPCCFQLAIDTEVVATKGSSPGNGDAYDGFAGY